MRINKSNDARLHSSHLLYRRLPPRHRNPIHKSYQPCHGTWNKVTDRNNNNNNNERLFHNLLYSSRGVSLRTISLCNNDNCNNGICNNCSNKQ